MTTKEDLEADFPPLMRQQIDALTEYARAHGRLWKEHLRAEWMNATAHPMLHHLRNTHGLHWLKQFKLPH